MFQVFILPLSQMAILTIAISGYLIMFVVAFAMLVFGILTTLRFGLRLYDESHLRLDHTATGQVISMEAWNQTKPIPSENYDTSDKKQQASSKLKTGTVKI